MAATARDLLAEKNSSVVYTVSPGNTVAEACRLMDARQVGCLVVMRGGAAEGIFTERDVVNRVVARGRDPEQTFVDDVMTRQVVMVGLDEPLPGIEQVMRARRIRHVPVVGERGLLLGMVSLGDVAAWRADPGLAGADHVRAGAAAEV